MGLGLGLGLQLRCLWYSSTRSWKALCVALAAAEPRQSGTVCAYGSPASSTLVMSLTKLAAPTTAWKAWFI